MAPNSVPVGTTSPVHLQENVRSLGLNISRRDLKLLDEASAAMPPPEIIEMVEVSSVLDGGPRTSQLIGGIYDGSTRRVSLQTKNAAVAL